MKRLLFLILIITNTVVWAAPASKIVEVKSVVKNYVESTYSADTKSLRNDIFHPKAIMAGDLPHAHLVGDINPFLKDLESRPSMKSQKIDYITAITYIDVQGNTAVVTLEEENFFGKGNFVNYLSLIKEEGKWKIISKIFTFK